MIIDTHAHYDDEAFLEDRETVFKEIKANGVGLVVNIGSTLASAKESVELAKQYDFIYAAVGVHPSEIEELTEEDMGWLFEASKENKVVAIGEIGLDYHYDEPDRELQKKWFIRQLKVAKETGLPVCIHSRDAAQDTLDIMKEWHSEGISGVIHCYSYGWEHAKVYLEMGFFLGIGGVVTFKNGKKLKEVVKNAPMESIVLETDAPYLAPTPYRGKRNHSGYLPLVAEAIAEIKGISKEEVIRMTEENAGRLYPKLLSTK
ncbi:MAG: TatD family hydrolase [Lachnospiraceae bacterium]|nr:TatD family hydrolase [Lachnospiraceae bacterium]